MQIKNEIRVIVIEPGKDPEIRYIEDSLKTLQSIVGGYIETATLPDGIVIICNEDGKLKGLNQNIQLGADTVVGNVIITKSDMAGEIASLSSNDIKNIKKYIKKYMVKN